MIRFTTPIDARAVQEGPGAGRDWILLRDLVADPGEAGGRDVIHIKKGFITDFGSVPAWAQVFVSPQGIAKPAYVLHDWLYKSQPYNQLVADGMLVDAMESLGVSWIQRVLIYRALRIGGSAAWNEHKRENNKLQADLLALNKIGAAGNPAAPGLLQGDPPSL